MKSIEAPWSASRRGLGGGMHGLREMHINTKCEQMYYCSSLGIRSQQTTCKWPSVNHFHPFSLLNLTSLTWPPPTTYDTTSCLFGPDWPVIDGIPLDASWTRTNAPGIESGWVLGKRVELATNPPTVSNTSWSSVTNKKSLETDSLLGSCDLLSGVSRPPTFSTTQRPVPPHHHHPCLNYFFFSPSFAALLSSFPISPYSSHMPSHLCSSLFISKWSSAERWGWGRGY